MTAENGTKGSSDKHARIIDELATDRMTGQDPDSQTSSGAGDAWLDQSAADQLNWPLKTPEYIPPEVWPLTSQADWNNGKDVGSYSPTSPVYGTDESAPPSPVRDSTRYDIRQGRYSSEEDEFNEALGGGSKSQDPYWKTPYPRSPPRPYPPSPPRDSIEAPSGSRSSSSENREYKSRSRSRSYSPRPRGWRSRYPSPVYDRRKERERSRQRATRSLHLSRKKERSRSPSKDSQRTFLSSGRNGVRSSERMKIVVHVLNERGDSTNYIRYTKLVKKMICQLHTIILRTQNEEMMSRRPIEVEDNPNCRVVHTPKSSFLSDLCENDLHVIFHETQTKVGEGPQQGNYVIIGHRGVFDRWFEMHVAHEICRLFGCLNTDEGIMSRLWNLAQFQLDRKSISIIKRTKFYLHTVQTSPKGISHRMIGNLLEIRTQRNITAFLLGTSKGKLLHANFLAKKKKLEFRVQMAEMVVVIDEDGSIYKIKL